MKPRLLIDIRSDTPLNDNHTLSTDTEKGIVVEAPSIGFAESAATMQNGDEIEEEEEVVTPFHKRKRASVNYNLDENDYKLVRGSPNIEPQAQKRAKISTKIRVRLIPY